MNPKIQLKPINLTDYNKRDLKGHLLFPPHIKNTFDKQRHMDKTAAFECPKCGGVIQAYSMANWNCMDCYFSDEKEKNNE